MKEGHMHSWAADYKAFLLCVYKKKQWVYRVQTEKTKNISFKLEAVINTQRHRWSLFFIHIPSKCFKGPSGEINAPCAVLDNRRVLYCCAYCSHRSASSVIKCYFNVSFTWGKTMNSLLLQEKGSVSHILRQTIWHHWEWHTQANT